MRARNMMETKAEERQRGLQVMGGGISRRRDGAEARIAAAKSFTQRASPRIAPMVEALRNHTTSFQYLDSPLAIRAPPPLSLLHSPSQFEALRFSSEIQLHNCSLPNFSPLPVISFGGFPFLPPTPISNHKSSNTEPRNILSTSPLMQLQDAHRPLLLPQTHPRPSDAPHNSASPVVHRHEVPRLQTAALRPPHSHVLGLDTGQGGSPEGSGRSGSGVLTIH